MDIENEGSQLIDNLRGIVASFAEYEKHYESVKQSVQKAAMLLHQLTRCEYCDNGVRCNETYVREVHGTKCCEEHAKIRS